MCFFQLINYSATVLRESTAALQLHEADAHLVEAPQHAAPGKLTYCCRGGFGVNNIQPVTPNAGEHIYSVQ